MEIFVNVEAEDLEGDRGPEKALSAYFTMVAMGKSGRPQSVPKFIVDTEEEKTLYHEAEIRKEQYKLRKQK